MWKTLAANFKEIFFPKQCFFCKEYGALICPDCGQLLEIASARRPDFSNRFLDDIYSACGYENKRVQKIVRALKYPPFCRELAAPLAKIVAGHFSMAAPDFDFGGFAIVPAPLAQKRIRQRGYNQSELIGQQLSGIWKIPIINAALTKIRDTLPQAELNQAQRSQNLKGAFVADRALVKNKKILLIDDVVTTGATLNECAHALKNAGAAKIIGVCLARTN